MKVLIIAAPKDNENGNWWQQAPKTRLWTLSQQFPRNCKGWDLRWPPAEAKTAALRRCENVDGIVHPDANQTLNRPAVLLTQRKFERIQRFVGKDFWPVTMIEKLNGVDILNRLAGSVEQLENQLLLRTGDWAGERGADNAVWQEPVPPREADTWLNPAIAIIDLESDNIAPREDGTPGNEVYDFLQKSQILICEPLQEDAHQQDELISLLSSAPFATASEDPNSVLGKLFFSPPNATPGFRKETWRRFWALDQLGGTFRVSETCSGEPTYCWIPHDNLTPIKKWYVEQWWQELAIVESADGGGVFPYKGEERFAPRCGVAHSTILVELPQPNNLGCVSTRIGTWHWGQSTWLDLIMSVEQGDNQFKAHLPHLGDLPPKAVFGSNQVPTSVAEIDFKSWWQEWLLWLWYGNAEDGFKRTGPMDSRLGELILGTDTLGSDRKSDAPSIHIHF